VKTWIDVLNLQAFTFLFPTIRRKHSVVPENVLQSAGSFRMLPKTSYDPREAFGRSRKRPTIREKLSDVPDNVLRSAGSFRVYPTTSFDPQETFGSSRRRPVANTYLSDVPENGLPIAWRFRETETGAPPKVIFRDVNIRCKFVHLRINLPEFENQDQVVLFRLFYFYGEKSFLVTYFLRNIEKKNKNFILSRYEYRKWAGECPNYEQSPAH
jgi:hypothetical protein